MQVSEFSLCNPLYRATCRAFQESRGTLVKNSRSLPKSRLRAPGAIATPGFALLAMTSAG
jgi:hypothetical protein